MFYHRESLDMESGKSTTGVFNRISVGLQNVKSFPIAWKPCFPIFCWFFCDKVCIKSWMLATFEQMLKTKAPQSKHGVLDPTPVICIQPITIDPYASVTEDKYSFQKRRHRWQMKRAVIVQINIRSMDHEKVVVWRDCEELFQCDDNGRADFAGKTCNTLRNSVAILHDFWYLTRLLLSSVCRNTIHPKLGPF